MKIHLTEESKILVIIAVVYLVILGLFLSKYDFNPSATIQLSKGALDVYNGKLPNNLIYFEHDGFDGQYYFFMALNPSFEKINISPHFLQRIIYPYTARLLAFGIDGLIPITMLLINFISILLSTYFVLKLINKKRLNKSLAYIWAFNIALLICITKDLTAPLMILFITISLYLTQQKKHKVSMIFLMLAILTRELALPVYAIYLFYFIYKREYKTAFIYSLAILPFIILQILLIPIHNKPPIIISSYSINRPIIGFIEYCSSLICNSTGIFNNIYSHSFQYAVNNQSMGINQTRLNIIENPKEIIYLILSDLNKVYSAITILIFAGIIAFILIKDFLKDKRITLISLILISQVGLLFSLNKTLFMDSGIDAIGRYAILMFLSSVLYFAEREKEYPLSLKIINLFLFIFYLGVILLIK